MEREQITVNIPLDLLEDIKREAGERGYTTTDLIIFTLWERYRPSNCRVPFATLQE